MKFTDEQYNFTDEHQKSGGVTPPTPPGRFAPDEDVILFILFYHILMYTNLYSIVNGRKYCFWSPALSIGLAYC